MVNLMNTCVLVKTRKEYEDILNEAEKQGFHWYKKDDCKPFEQYTFPDILKFSSDNIIYRRSGISLGYTFYEASELLGTEETKEMTTRDLVEWLSDARRCSRRECPECVLYERNTKCNKYLCNIFNWKDNIDELLEIAQNGEFTVPTPEEKAVSTIENFIENPDCLVVNDEFVESLKFVVEKLKEVK